MYPRTSYIIYATQRSGSTLLCEALGKTNVAGRPGEYFTPAHASYYSELWNIPLRDGTSHLGEDYFRCIYATATPNGVFGTKLIWELFPYCLEQIRKLEGNQDLALPELVSTAFPQHQAIMITRRDTVRQAISWWKAEKTNVWWHWGVNPKEEMAKALKFDFQGIEKYRQSLMHFEQRMQIYFSTSGIQPLHVVYEDFVASYEETTFQLLDYLHLPVPRHLAPGKPLLQKQADAQTEEWVQQYYQTKQEQEKNIV